MDPREESMLMININKISDKVQQINGQKIYRNVPESWVGEDPSRDCEIFIGRIPRDCSLERELVPLFETAGHLFEFRLMVQFSGCNRGYGYAMYTNEEDAQRAIIKYNDFTIRPTWQLGVCRTDNNCRLFMKRLPMDVSSLEVSKQIYQISDEVIEVYIKRGPQSLSAVIEFRNHRGAAIARKMLVPIALSNWGTSVQVDWSRHDWFLDFTQYLEVAHREGNEIRIRGIDKVKLRGNFVAGRSGGRSHSSYRRNKLIMEAQCKRSSSAENPFPRNFNVKDLNAKILQYAGMLSPSTPENEPSNNGVRYRPILPTSTIHEIEDSSTSHQEANNPIPIRQRPILQMLDLHKQNTFKFYGSEMSESPGFAHSNMSSPLSSQETGRHNSNMELSPNGGSYYSSSMYSPSTPSTFTPSNPTPYSHISSNYSSSNYTPSTLTLSPSPWFSELNSNSPRIFKFPSASNISLACSSSVSSPAMFDDNLSQISPNKNDQVFFPSNSQGSDSRRYPIQEFGYLDQGAQFKSEIVSRPTFDFDRFTATDSLYSFAGDLSSNLDAGYSGNVCQASWSQLENETFGVKGLLEKANGDAESMFFDQSILPSEDFKDNDMLINFMKRNSGTSSDEEYNIWGFNSKPSSGEDAK